MENTGVERQWSDWLHWKAFLAGKPSVTYRTPCCMNFNFGFSQSTIRGAFQSAKSSGLHIRKVVNGKMFQTIYGKKGNLASYSNFRKLIIRNFCSIWFNPRFSGIFGWKVCFFLEIYQLWDVQEPFQGNFTISCSRVESSGIFVWMESFPAFVTRRAILFY